MALTYTWKITNLRKVDELEGNPNVLVHVRWIRTGTDEDGVTGEFNGATPLRLPESGSSFAPMEEVTEEQVLEWVKAEIADRHGYESHIVEQITKQINAKKNPVREVELLPWGVQAVGVASRPGTPESYVSGSTGPVEPTPQPRYIDSIGL